MNCLRHEAPLPLKELTPEVLAALALELERAIPELKRALQQIESAKLISEGLLQRIVRTSVTDGPEAPHA